MSRKKQRFATTMRTISNTTTIFMVLMAFCTIISIAQEEAWTWLYQKKFSINEQVRNSTQADIHFAQYDVPAFTQLVFSWNGFRSCQGYFSFWAQARDAETKTWGRWHKMIDWGANVQRSYLSKQGEHSSYHHVRLEMAPDKAGDAFRVRVVAHDGADLSLLKRIAVCLSHFKKFKSEEVNDACLSLPSVYVKGVPQQSQLALGHEDSRKMCSPTSCSMLLGFLIRTKIDPIEFAARSYDAGLGAYGSWPFNTAHAFERCNGQAWFTAARLPSFAALHKKLQQGMPVVVSVRGELEGAPKPYENGHLMIIVGWNAHKREVICHDPAVDEDQKTVIQYPIEHFLRAWERSHRLSYLAEPAKSF